MEASMKIVVNICQKDSSAKRPPAAQLTVAAGSYGRYPGKAELP
jgi:hypothetical protein